MSTRKRGRISNKKIYGGVLEETRRATTQAEAQQNLEALNDVFAKKPTSQSFTQKLRSKLPSVNMPKLSSVNMPKLSSVNMPKLPSFGTAFAKKPAPSSGATKIKPDNLLVPMVINLEQNKVLLGSNIYPIVNGVVSDDTNEPNSISNVYTKYIVRAKHRILTETNNQEPINEEIKTAVRNIVKEEFLTQIINLLASNDLNSISNLANNAIELGMDYDRLFSNILCIILSPISSQEQVIGIGQLINDPPPQFSDEESNENPPVTPIEQRLNKLRDATPTQLSAAAEMSELQSRLDALGPDPKNTDKSVLDIKARVDALSQPEASSNEIDLPVAPANTPIKSSAARMPVLEHRSQSLSPTAPQSFTVAVDPNTSGQLSGETDLTTQMPIKFKIGEQVRFGKESNEGKIVRSNDDGTYSIRPLGRTNTVDVELSDITSMDAALGGGARRLKKTRKHRKRSKRKTSHYLRIK